MKNRNNIFVKILFVIGLIILSISHIVAQKKWKDYLITGSSVFVSGMIDGTIETINYHYETGFKSRFPKANDQFWNPAVSWTNKYKEGNPSLGPKFTGSTTLFVCSTDAYHMLRTSKRTLDGVTLVYYVNKSYNDKKTTNKKKWINAAKDFAILTAIRCVGFHLTYSLIFKPKPTY
jgi:hypothetical protein